MTPTIPGTDVARGVLLGLACGHAAGRPESAGSAVRDRRDEDRGVTPARDAPDAGATELARSLVDRGAFHTADLASRLPDREKPGRRGPSEPSGEGPANDGCLVRGIPLAVAYAGYPAALVRTSVDAAGLTHADPRCTLGSAVLNLTVAACSDGVGDPLQTALGLLSEGLATRMHRQLGVIPEGSNAVLEGGLPAELERALEAVPGSVDESTLGTTGGVTDTLETALFYGLEGTSVEAAVLGAVDSPGDTRTVGAVTGAVAGARHGVGSVPGRWLDGLDDRPGLEGLADALAAHPW